METKLFQFEKDSRSMELSYEDLRLSRQSQNNEISSWDFIGDIIKILNERGIDHNIDRCYVKKETSKLSPTREEKEKYNEKDRENNDP